MQNTLVNENRSAILVTPGYFENFPVKCEKVSRGEGTWNILVETEEALKRYDVKQLEQM